jgi:ribonuclease P protein component
MADDPATSKPSARKAPLGRLTKRPEFLAAQAGKRFHTARISLQGLLRDDSDGLRFGLTVTKRVGHATERNRIRRRLRAALPRAANGHLDRNADIVVIGRRDALGVPFDILVDDLARGLRAVTKARVEKPDPPATDARRRGPSSHA